MMTNMNTLFTIDSLVQENSQLREELSKSHALVAQREQELGEMQRRLLHLEPPSSPKSIIEESTSSSSRMNSSVTSHQDNDKYPPLVSSRASTGNYNCSSSQLDKNTNANYATNDEKSPTCLLSAEIITTNDSLSRRLSSITLPDMDKDRHQEDQNKEDKDPNNKNTNKRPLVVRRSTHLPSTPERSLLIDDGDHVETTSLGRSTASSSSRSIPEDPAEADNNATIATEVVEVVEDSTGGGKDNNNNGNVLSAEESSPVSPTTSHSESTTFTTNVLPNTIAGQPPLCDHDQQDQNQQEPTRRPMKTAFKPVFMKTAVKGLPREGSIENHSDDDITVYPEVNPAYNPSTPLEVHHRQVLDACNERGLYTGSLHRKTHLPDGYGTMKYHKGPREYAGDWEHGHWHGHGTLRNASGDVYEGPFCKDEREGTAGTLTYADGRVFTGRFRKDAAREGKLIFPDASYYEGLMQNGKRNGFGLYVFSDASHYEGQWQDDQMHGRGRMEWTDGGWYNGDWHFGIMSGIGLEVLPDGTVRHQGQFLNGKPVHLADRV
jgi:hypothetical protein